jgi:uncharacterized protein (DUF1684 family)
MNTYALMVVFTMTGDAYVEQGNLSLQDCGTLAAIKRQEQLALWAMLEATHGRIHYRCEREEKRK